MAIEPAELAVVARHRRRRRRARSPIRAHPALGWRAYLADPAALLAGIGAARRRRDRTARRVALGVPETGVELLPDDSYILEMGFERLNGVDFRKGCYVGQEVTARMKHKTELRKGLARVRVEGAAPPPGTEIRSGEQGGRHAPFDGRRARASPTCASTAPTGELTAGRGAGHGLISEGSCVNAS